MGKLKQFASVQIRKITGGKDPIKLIEEFIVRRGFNPDECKKERSADNARWMLPIAEDEELEVLAEGLTKPAETTIYMGINVATVPIRGCHNMLAAALQIADGLVGIKVSLVGHFLVLSSSMAASGLNVEDIDYSFEIVTAQKAWFKETLADELGWEELPEE